MERRRLQQQRMKQQQRFCISQQDLTQAITRMKPKRRATHNNLLSISTSSLSSSCSVQTLTVPSVSQLIKDFEARTVSTPYVSAQDCSPDNNVIISTEPEIHAAQLISIPTMNIKADNNNQAIDDKEQIYQTLDNDHYKQNLSSSFYCSTDSNNTIIQMLPRSIDITSSSSSSSQHDKRFNEIRTKEAQLNNALADLISLSNDADISSSISSSSRSLIINSQQHRRASTVNDKSNSISESIALLNNLLETFDLQNNEEYKKKNENIKPINMFR